MRRLPILVVGTAALFLVLGNRSASALTATLQSPTAIAVGQPQTFKVAVKDAVGAVAISWNFGDGGSAPEAPALEAAHTFQQAGHFIVIVRVFDDAAQTTANTIQTVYFPKTAKPPSNSSSIILDVGRHKLWNVNPDSNSVTIVDTVQLKRLREIPVGKEPHFLAQAPDGAIWVANQMSDELTVLDPDSGDVKATLPLPYASQPRSVAFGPTGLGYVSLFATGKLVEFDPTLRRVTREVAVGPTPAGVSVASDGRILVTRFLSPADHGEVWVVSPQNFTVSNTITLAFDPGPDTQSSGRGVPNYVSAAVISPDGTQAWVTVKKDNVARGIQRDKMPLTPDNFVRPATCTIDMKTEKEVLANRRDIDNRATPVAVAFSALGDYTFVLIQPSNWIGVMNAYDGEAITGIRDVGNAPDGLVLADDGRLFVHAYLSREVIVYDVRASVASTDQIAPAAVARIRTIDVEPLAPQILLGKQIFFNAADTRMGHAGYMACVSCHFGGYSDGRVWDFTDRGEGLRNTKSLLGNRGMAEGAVHWSANFDELQDFERDIRHDFGGSGFMSDTEFNARTGADGRYDPFSKKAAGVSRELDALAAFISSWDKVPRSPFKNPDGSFTPAALEGRKVFLRAGCAACHMGPDLTDSAQGSRHDVGTLLPSSGQRLFQKLEFIDTPSLKGLWQTAPYYHDGRAATLMEIFTMYNQGDKMGVTSDLSTTELEQLVEYLRELDDVPEPPTVVMPQDDGMVRGYCSVGPVSGVGQERALWGSAAAMAVAGVAMARRRRSRRRPDEASAEAPPPQ